MTNIYFLSKGGNPSGFSKITSFNGRYPKNTSTLENQGVTGGAATHANTPTLSSEGAATNTHYSYASSSDPDMPHAMGDHQNHPVAALSVDPAPNDPPFFTYELICMDLATWVNGYRRVPENGVVLSAAALTWDEVTRDTDADGKLIKLDTAGSTGGTATRDHVVRITLGNGTPGFDYAYPDANGVRQNVYHGHPEGTGNTDAKTTVPKHVTTRIYKVGSIRTTKALAGMIAFLDGADTSGYFDPINWNDAYIMGGNQDAAITGSNTHPHPNASFYSGTSTAGQPNTTASPTGGDGIVEGDHAHLLTVTIQDANHEPLNVQLYPVKLNTTLYSKHPMIVNGC